MTDRTVSTTKYALIQGGYWMGYCISISYAAVYLRSMGFSNAQLGIVLAVGNTLSFLLGVWLAALVDRRTRWTLLHGIAALLALQIVCLTVLIARPGYGIVTALAFTGYLAFCISVNSMNLKLCVDYNHAGGEIDFGAARGVGALIYVLLATFLGTLVSLHSTSILPRIGIAIVLFQLALSVSLWRDYRRLDAAVPASAPERPAMTSSLGGFVRENRRFALFLCGIALVYMAHSSINSYLVNIVEALGGDTRQLGYMQGFSTALEVPVMVLFGRFAARKRNVEWVRISLVFFVLKSAAVAAAGSMAALCLAFLFQPVSFALFTVAVVPYVDEVIPYRNSAKGQSLTYSMSVVGLVLSSLVTGRLLDVTSVAAAMWVCAAFGAVGAIIAFFSASGAKAPEGSRLRRGGII